jgi:hypothetical protein
MGQLKNVGIGSGFGNETTDLFEKIIPDFLKIKYSFPNDYVSQVWQMYEKKRNSNSLNGPFFELILATLFIRENLIPFYLQAQVAFIPNVSYDLLLITEAQVPIAISAKTSLRERYKQADLEAIALKNVHRRAENYLLTLDTSEAKRVRTKIKNGDVIGLNDVIVAFEPEMNDFIALLKKKKYISSPSVQMVRGRMVNNRSGE